MYKTIFWDKVDKDLVEIEGEFFNIEKSKIFESNNLIDDLLNAKGQFAVFKINSLETKSVQLITDQFSTVPIYYFTNNNFLIFSSSLTDIINNALYEKKINLHAVENFLRFKKTIEQETLWENIKQVLPGTILTITQNKIKCANYCKIKINNDIDNNDSKDLNITKKVINNAINIRLNKFCNNGSHLSGGIDSSVITSVAANILESNKFYTYEIRTDYDINDERDYAQDVVNKYKTSHSIIKYTDVEYDLERKFIEFQGLPDLYITPVVLQLKLLEKVKANDVKILLVGTGGDQVFGLPSEYLDYLFEMRHWCDLKKALILCENTRSKGKEDFKILAQHRKIFTLRKLMQKLNSKEYLYFFELMIISFFYFNNGVFFLLKPIFNKFKRVFFTRKELILKQKEFIVSKKEILEENNLFETNFYFKCVFSKGYFKTLSQYYSMSQFSDISIRFPVYDFDLINHFSKSDKKANFYNAKGRGVVRIAMKDVLPNSIFERGDKTEYIAYVRQYCCDFINNYPKLFVNKNANLWTFVNKDEFFKIANLITNKEKNVNDINSYIVVFKRIIALAIWLDIFFSSEKQ